MHDYVKNKIQWQLYLERKQPLMLFAAFIQPYGPMLKEATGFGFEHQLHFFRGDTGVFYRSLDEMQSADEYFLSLVKGHDRRLRTWCSEGLAHNDKANELIKMFSGDTEGSKAIARYSEVERECETIMLYGTVIPYRILSGINSVIEQRASTEEFRDIMEIVEPLRARTQYPQLVDVVYRYYVHIGAKLVSVEDSELLWYLTPDELGEALRDPASFAGVDILQKRRDGCSFWLDTGRDGICFNYDSNYLEQIGISAKLEHEVKEIRGNIANKGVVRGKVKIVNTTEDMAGFEEGDIIVSINTNPSLMPVLMKCAGIVTDEGGIMCHAAIVSRELNKPCIIGTKIATKVLKDRDIVEVDADKGVVRIILK